MYSKERNYKILSACIDDRNLSPINDYTFESMGISENKDLHSWVIKNPRELLLEDMIIVDNEYSNFENIRRRPDILGVDREGKLVVIEVKRDKADKTTDAQAISYAGYCSVITSEQIQNAYLQFRNRRFNDNFEPKDVGLKFSNHLKGSGGEVGLTKEGWADFNLDNKPRILLLASSFPPEVTSPIMWLRQEYGLDIKCITISPYKHNGEVFISTRQVIPLPESEDYMAKIKDKNQEQESSDRRRRAVKVLFERGALEENDTIEFNKDVNEIEKKDIEEYGENNDIWKAKVIRKSGNKNFRWLHNNEEHSATSMAKAVIKEVTGQEKDTLPGTDYWCHPLIHYKTLADIRDEGFDKSDRESP